VAKFIVVNRVPSPPDMWIRVNSHPAIIENKDFERVQACLDSRRPERTGGRARAEGVFAGLLRCGGCGGALTMTNGTGRDGTRHHYYGCCTHMRGKVRCNFKNARVDTFDPWLISELLDKVLTPEAIQNVIHQVVTLSDGWRNDRKTRREAMVRELRATEARRGKLYSVLEMMGMGAPNLADLGPRLRELNDHIRQIEQSLTKLEEEVEAPAGIQACDPWEVAGMLRGLVQDCADPRKQRTFMGSFIEKATVSGDAVAVEYNEGRMMSLGSTVRSEGKWLLGLGSNQEPMD
jgi:site-specific DNA recombinase